MFRRQGAYCWQDLGMPWSSHNKKTRSTLPPPSPPSSKSNTRLTGQGVGRGATATAQGRRRRAPTLPASTADATPGRPPPPGPPTRGDPTLAARTRAAPPMCRGSGTAARATTAARWWPAPPPLLMRAPKPSPPRRWRAGAATPLEEPRPRLPLRRLPPVGARQTECAPLRAHPHTTPCATPGGTGGRLALMRTRCTDRVYSSGAVGCGAVQCGAGLR